jgi:hypothetical protein
MEAFLLKATHLTKGALILLIIIMAFTTSWAKEKEPLRGKKETNLLEQEGRVFDMEVPAGFKQDPIDEAGMVRWTKARASIYLIVGDLIAESGTELFEQIVEAAGKNEKIESVRRIDLKGGQALQYTEKAPESPDRLRTMRFIVITDKKVINVDFTAPSKDFDSFASDFEATVKSFKLRSSGS